MIKYGLKLWSNNEKWFKQAKFLYKNKKIDFIELYYNHNKPLNYEKISELKKIPICIHNYHDAGFNEFRLGEKDMIIWENTIKLADFLKSEFIVIHPGINNTLREFLTNLKKIDNDRILIENMAGLDINRKKMFGQTLRQLKQLNKQKRICFDFEKAIKAAKYQNIDYKQFITDCIKNLKPFYFHLSGGDINSPVDQHLNLWEANFDLKWVKKLLLGLTQNKNNYLVFETPKNNLDLENDIKNIGYFKKYRILQS